MEAALLENKVKKDTISCKGYKVANKEGNPDPDVELLQPWNSQ
jgi:hypothetical protein